MGTLNLGVLFNFLYTMTFLYIVQNTPNTFLRKRTGILRLFVLDEFTFSSRRTHSHISPTETGTLRKLAHMPKSRLIRKINYYVYRYVGNTITIM